jgi:hypothetical protein
MTRARITSLAALLAVAVLGIPAAAESEEPCTDEDGNLVFEPHQSWITQEGTKAGNLAVTDAQDFPTWHDEEPTVSFQDGAGSGYLGTRFSDFLVTEQHPITTLTMEGTHTGCLDVIAIELFLIDPGDGLFVSPHTIRPNLTVNGSPVYQHIDSAGITANVDENPHGDLTIRARFAFTDIHRVLADCEGMRTQGSRQGASALLRVDSHLRKVMAKRTFHIASDGRRHGSPGTQVVKHAVG